MNGKQIILVLVLVDFLGLTAYAVHHHGYLGFFEEALSSPATLLLGVDLLICLGLVLLWMRHDARARGAAFWPYALVALAFGGAGPLLYLIRREGRATEVPGAQPALQR